MRTSITFTSVFLALAVAAAASPVALQEPLNNNGQPQLQKRLITTVLGIGALAAGAGAMHAVRRAGKRLRDLELEVEELEAQVAEAERRLCSSGRCHQQSQQSQRLQKRLIGLVAGGVGAGLGIGAAVKHHKNKKRERELMARKQAALARLQELGVL
jgi:uncharacterized membrane protein YidH (DUF202 family)